MIQTYFSLFNKPVFTSGVQSLVTHVFCWMSYVVSLLIGLLSYYFQSKPLTSHRYVTVVSSPNLAPNLKLDCIC